MSYNLNTNESSKLLYISSSKIPEQLKKNTLNTYFTIQLASPIIANDKEHILMSLYSASLPMSFYNIKSNENRFYITANFIDNSTYTAEIFIDPGNYNINQIYSAIKSKLAQVQLPTIGNMDVITFTYIPQLNKTSIIVNTNTYNIISVTINWELSTISKILGFTNLNQTINLNNLIISPNMILLYDIFSIFIKTNIGITNNYDQNGDFTDILERIPVVDPYKVKFFEPPAQQHKTLIKSKAVSIFDVKITDQDDNLIDFNGLPFELVFKFDIVKDLERGENLNLRELFQDIIDENN